MFLTWLAATARSAAFARTGPRCQAALIRSIRQSVAAPIAAEFSAVGVTSAPGQDFGRLGLAAAVASAPAASAWEPKIAAHSDAAAARNGPRGLLVLQAPRDRVQEYLQARRTAASPGG